LVSLPWRGLAQAQSAQSDPWRRCLKPRGPHPAGSGTIAPRIALASLRDRIAALGRAFNGRAGISIVSLSDGWQADYNATTLFRSKAAPSYGRDHRDDAVDKGRVNLNDRVTLGRND
jgi:hypothetical protein